jgi:ATP-dependent helicase/DNAse subunit B
VKLLEKKDLPDNAITLSPSQLNLFQRCAYKWKLSKKEGRQEFQVTDTGKMTLGTMFHKMLQNYYGRYIGQPVANLSSEQLVEIMETTQAENGWTDYESQLLFMNAYTIFITYIGWAARNEKLIPLGVEVDTYAPTGLVSTAQTGRRPIFLHGIMDLVAERSGTIGVVDHKTHTNRPWNENDILFDTQMLFYPLLLKLQGVDVDWCMISTANMHLPKKDLHASLQREERFRRFVIKQTNVSLDRYKEEVFAIIAQMWMTPGFQYVRRIDRFCSGCGYNELCGMHLRGYDIDELIETKFTPTTMKAVEFDASELLGSSETDEYPSLP